MRNRSEHSLHAGERHVQEQMHTPRELADQIPTYIQSAMPLQYAAFFSQLPYLSLAAMDGQGRPWVGLLVTQSAADPSVGIRVGPNNITDLQAEVNPCDPFVRAVQRSVGDASNPQSFFAGVGVDFSNRARIKIAGEIADANTTEPGRLSLRLNSDQHLGNCPKYITIRNLQHCKRTAEVDLDQQFESLIAPLPEFCREHINRVSTVFLATKHMDATGATHSHMGLNHRGGAPGFVRVYEEQLADRLASYLVLPDYSGNRFYQSLGNIQSDGLVGMVLPDFATGNLLYITGKAENLFGAEAEELMSRMSLVTRIEITGAVFVRAGLNLELVSAEEFSPYNPPLRYLNRELAQLGYPVGPGLAADGGITAKLISTRKLSAHISTFTFRLSEPVEPPAPGGFGVFDFSDSLRIEYAHMNERNPQALNEDGIRTWTLSSAPDFNLETGQFDPIQELQVTVKRKAGGLISNYLHGQGAAAGEPLQLKFKGTGGKFSCFSRAAQGGALPSVPAKMLWVAGGVGITPFLSMWAGLFQLSKLTSSERPLTTDIVLLFAGRDDDLELVRQFLVHESPGPNVALSVRAFQSVSNRDAGAQEIYQLLVRDFAYAPLSIEQRRLQSSDFAQVANLREREVYLCGPDGFMESSDEALRSLGVSELQIHRESFYF